MIDDLFLRDAIPEDLPLFFRRELDSAPEGTAAYTAGEPVDWQVFDGHWQLIRADPSVIIKTIVFHGQVAGSVMSYEESGQVEVSYCLGEEFRGQGIATRALQEFLARVNTKRPIYACAGADNAASLRVLRKCGFAMDSRGNGFAHARQHESDEILLVLEQFCGV